MRKKHLIFLSILLLLMTLLGACSNNNAEEANNVEDIEEVEKIFDPEPDPNVIQISSYNDERMERQAAKDKGILAEYEEEDYTVDESFVKLDPYDVSPLSALVVFKTNEPVTIHVTTGTEKYEEAVT